MCIYIFGGCWHYGCAFDFLWRRHDFCKYDEISFKRLCIAGFGNRIVYCSHFGSPKRLFSRSGDYAPNSGIPDYRADCQCSCQYCRSKHPVQYRDGGRTGIWGRIAWPGIWCGGRHGRNRSRGFVCSAIPWVFIFDIPSCHIQADPDGPYPKAGELRKDTENPAFDDSACYFQHSHLQYQSDYGSDNLQQYYVCTGIYGKRVYGDAGDLYRKI